MDRVVKALIFNGEISVTLLDTTEMVNRAIDIHGLSPLAAAALGRTMTAATFMATNLKNKDDTLSITITGDGPLGSIVVCGNHDLKMRGYVDNPTIELPLKPNGKLDVGKAVGRGRLTVVKNLGLKEPYTGSARLVSGEIAEDFAAYYTFSEQQPTGMALGVKIGKDLKCVGAGGLVIQPMPGASDESIDKAEKLLAEFTKVSTMIEELGIDGIIDKFFDGVFFFEYLPEYKCTCSKEYVDRIIVTLGEKELYDTIDKEGKIEVVCHFCPQKYVYYKDDVDKLLNDGNESC